MSGLTLIEVLIALAIVGIAMTAIIKSSSENIRGTSHLQNKMIATWVGMEVMGEVQTGLLALRLTEAKQAKVNMLNRDWYYRVSLDETGNAHTCKISLQVSTKEGDENPLVTLESYRYDAEKN